MEKDPNQRYETAKAFAEDIERFLNGDPVKARKSTFFYYLYKKIKKNKLIYMTSFFAFIVVLAFSLMWAQERISSIRKAKIMQKFGEDIKEVESIMRYSHLLPLHNNFKEKETVLKKVREIEERMKKIGKYGQGAGNYALGRAYYSLGDTKKAYYFYQEALKNKYDEPEFYYSLGLLFGEIYQEELIEVERIKNKELKEAKKGEIENNFKKPALYYIQQGKKTLKGMAFYAEALISFYEKEYDKALKSMEKLKESPNWFYEIYKLKGDLYLSLAQEKEGVGEIENALREYEKAEELYSRAQEIGRSDGKIYMAKADLLRLKMKLKAQKGEIEEEIFKQALKETENALVIDPDNERIYNLKSLLYWNWANEIFKSGKDPLGLLNEAIFFAEKGIKLKKDFSNAYTNRGIAYIIKSTYESQTGKDPFNSIQKGIESYEEAIKLDPKNVLAYVNAGNAYTIFVEYY